MGPTPDNSAFTRVDEPSPAEAILDAGGCAKAPISLEAVEKFITGFQALCKEHGLMAAEAVCHTGGGAFEAAFYSKEMGFAAAGLQHAAEGRAPAPEIDPLLLSSLQHMAEVFPKLHAGQIPPALSLGEAIRRVFPASRPPATSTATYQRN